MEVIQPNNEPTTSGNPTIIVGWVPVVGWILWVLGLIFSCVGVFRTPKGLAIAGLIISLLGVILLLFVFAGLFAAAAVSAI